MNLKQMSPDQLYEELRSRICDTAASIRRLAAVWSEMEGRGLDLSGFNSPHFKLLALVSSNSLLPELFLRYSYSPSLLRNLATLIPEEQAKLVSNGGLVEILDNVDDAPIRVQLDDIPIKQVKQAIGEGKIRTAAEQRHHLPPRRAVTSKRPNANSENIMEVLTPGQQRVLRNAASRGGRTPTEQAARWLIQDKRLPETPVVVTKRLRTTLQEALRRPQPPRESHADAR